MIYTSRYPKIVLKGTLVTNLSHRFLHTSRHDKSSWQGQAHIFMRRRKLGGDASRVAGNNYKSRFKTCSIKFNQPVGAIIWLPKIWRKVALCREEGHHWLLDAGKCHRWGRKWETSLRTGSRELRATALRQAWNIAETKAYHLPPSSHPNISTTGVHYGNSYLQFPSGTDFSSRL